jgi:thioredoxin 1
MAQLASVDQSSFKTEVLDQKGLTLVDFWAEWCGPCRVLGPILDQVATEMGPKVKIVKVNADQNPDLASEYGVRGLPTVIFFRGGEAVAEMVGLQQKSTIVSAIEEELQSV